MRKIECLSLHFGGFQAAMPVIGWLAGKSVRVYIAAYDHWVAFGILLAIGAKMTVDALRRRAVPEAGGNLLRHGELLMLSLATSIDALAVGVSIAMLRVQIWAPAIVTGVVTGALSAVGLELGDRIGRRFGQAAEAFGGLLLCALGLKILSEHLLLL